MLKCLTNKVNNEYFQIKKYTVHILFKRWYEFIFIKLYQSIKILKLILEKNNNNTSIYALMIFSDTPFFFGPVQSAGVPEDELG